MAVYARVVGPSESASLHGQKAVTPMIAGIVSGTCVGVAWIVGFIIYFVKRRRRKQAAIAAGFQSHKDYIFTKAVANPPAYIIPPDPACAVVSPQPKKQPGGETIADPEKQPEPHVDVHSVPPSPSIQRKYSQSEYTPVTGSSTPMMGGFSSSMQDSTTSFLSTRDSDSHFPMMSRKPSTEGDSRR